MFSLIQIKIIQREGPRRLLC